MANAFEPRDNGKKVKDSVTVFLGSGRVFSGWKTVTVTKNLDSLSNSFSMTLFDKFSKLGQEFPIKPGELVKINIGQERVVTGYVETYESGYGSSSRDISISGRSLNGDLVDCSIDGAMEFNNIELEELAKQLIAPFGLKVFLSVVPKKIEKFSVKPGETVFEALDRAARLQGFFWISTRNGNIRLTEAARARATSELAQDFNLLGASLSIDTSKRFNSYKVLGQSPGSDVFNGANASGAEGTAKDNGISRNRPLVLIAEGAVDSEKATTRAQWEAATRVAQGSDIGCKVQGWQQANGELWGINQLVRFKSSFLGINDDLLINSVTHTKSNSGTFTDISLIRKDALKAQPEFKEKDDLLSQLGGV